MKASATDDLTLGPRHHVRIRRWRGDPTAAHLGTYTDQPLGAAELSRVLELIAERGYSSVVTSALAPAERRPYEDAGFEIIRELELLERRVQPRRELPQRSWRAVRRATTAERGALTDLDNQAFEPFWHLDPDGLRDALEATPRGRLRVTADRPPSGYAISGVAGTTGYLQRLAVAPDAQRGGRGRALVIDALRWMEREGAASALVNTQVDNTAALALYQSLGFTRKPGGLAILGLQRLG